jgi:hypothetical protein
LGRGHLTNRTGAVVHQVVRGRKDREYKPSRHGLCEGGVIEKAKLVDADIP